MNYTKVGFFIWLVLFQACFYISVNGQLKKKTKIKSAKNLTCAELMVDNIDFILSYELPKDPNIRLGYLDIRGNVAIAPEFQICSDFYGEFANVVKDSIYGYVDRKGKVKLFPGFELLFWYYGEIGIAKRNGFYGLINRNGKLVTECKYEMINLPHNGYFPVRQNNRWKVINDKGADIFPENIILQGHPVFDSKTIVIDTVLENGKKTVKRGIINVNGKKEIQAKYDYISGYFSEGLMLVGNNRKKGFVDKKGIIVIPIEYEALRDEFSENLVGARKDNKWGYINKVNQLVIPYEYSMVEKFSNGFAVVQSYGKSNYINKANEVITIDSAIQIPWQGSFHEGLAVVKYKNKYGFIDTLGRMVIPAKYDNLLPFINGFSHVTISGYNGIIDKNGKDLIPPIYKQLWFIKEGLIRFVK